MSIQLNLSEYLRMLLWDTRRSAESCHLCVVMGSFELRAHDIILI